MSTPDAPAAAPAFGRNARVLTFASLLGTTVVTLLVAGELATIAAAFVYSLAVLLHLSNGVAAGLAVVVGLPALWGIAVVAKLAFDAETDPVNN